MGTRSSDRRSPSADSRWRTPCGPSRSIRTPRAGPPGCSGSSIGCVANHRLRPHVLRRRTLHLRHLVAHLRPVLVQPPRQRRHPGEAALDHQHAQFGKTLEHAFQDQAGRPASASCASGCDAPRYRTQASRSRSARGRTSPPTCSPIGRPWCLRPPRRSASSAGGRAAPVLREVKLDLRETPVAGALLDLLHRRLGVVLDGTWIEARSRGSCEVNAATCQSFMALHSAAPEFQVALQVARRSAARSTPNSMPLRVEMLLAHEIEVASPAARPTAARHRAATCCGMKRG